MKVAALFLALSAGVSQGDTVSRRTIERELIALVHIDSAAGADGRTQDRFVGFNIDSVRTGSLLRPFLRAHGSLVWYLATHTRGAEPRLLGEHDVAAVVRDSIVAALSDDPAFFDRVVRMVAGYWSRPHHRTIAGYTAPAARDRISATQLNRVGARMFYPDRMSMVGDTLFTHICAGANGMGDLPVPVDPVTAAFVFATVSRAAFKPQSALMQAYDTAISRAKATSVSKDPATRILRAQGALWAQLEQSPALTHAMAAAYVEHQRVLPFRITPDPKRT